MPWWSPWTEGTPSPPPSGSEWWSPWQGIPSPPESASEWWSPWSPGSGLLVRYGDGPPALALFANVGDLYIDLLSGDVYEFEV